MDFGGRQLYTRGVLQKLDDALENMIKTPKNGISYRIKGAVKD